MLDKYIKTKTFSYIYSISMAALAVFIIVIGWDKLDRYSYIIPANQYLYIGLQVLVLITSVMLVISSRLTDAMLPAMLLAVIATVCYNSAAKFTSPTFIWVAVPAVASVIFHFIKYRKPFRIGRSFWGLCAISVALILGGIGHITASDYFGGAALFYVFGLGLGMVVFYLLLKTQVEHDTPENVARNLYIVGLIASFSIFWLYVSNWDLAKNGLIEAQFGNNISTMIMMAMPFAFYYTSKKSFNFISIIAMLLALVLSGSRGGLVMGGIEVAILLVVYAVFYDKMDDGVIIRRVVYFGILIVTAVLMWYYLPEIAGTMRLIERANETRFDIIKSLINDTFSDKETRVQLLKRMVEDFRSNPIFGVGIGYTGNSDLYSPVKGAMNWYHMWIAQVVGSLGVVGILGYGYQLVDRVIILLKNRNFTNLTMFMSYVGLFLMSQVNPGEFCPVPYAMLAVTYFAFMEKNGDDRLLFQKEYKKIGDMNGL